jgi:predicted O-linked N-acetylglucosamine transferase (SPINDLY family)
LQFNQALALLHQAKLAEAELICAEVLSQQPNHFDALHLLGIIAAQTQRTERAAQLIRKAIGLNPNIASAHSNLGHALTELKHPAEALASYDKAIILKPDYAEADNGRGVALLNLNRPTEALASYDKAIALKPGYAEPYNNRGTALLDQNRPADALASYDKAIALKPGHAKAYYNRGNALHDLKRYEEAVASYDKAIALQPQFAEAYVNRGNALQEAKRHEQAFASYDKALALDPDLDEVQGLRFHTKMHLCDWTNFDTEYAQLISSVRKGNIASPPFPLLALPSSPDDQLRCAKQYVAANVILCEEPVWQGERYNNERIRVAYLSADFRQHPGAYLIAGLIEQHDRSRFEIIGVSFGVDDRSKIRKRLVTAFDKFYDVQTKSDQEVAKLLRDLQVDIAVDRNGHTLGSRIGIFACRPAPIQVSFLGYPGTTGTQFIDYIIADKVVAPLEHQQFFTEKIVHLPDCYQINDSKRKIAENTPARQAVDLPDHGFVFCCFNNNYKIIPPMFDLWMRILKNVDDSVLWLLSANAAAESNLRKEAEARGIKSARLIFARRVPLADHLARHRLADLFLDTLPYNAHTTASDALWAGLPVLTCLGEAFAGRVAASLLNAIRLPDLITTTLEDYEQLAIQLATNPEKLPRRKRRLAENRLTTPLFDTELFAKDIEAAYTTMYKRHITGLAPEYIAITDQKIE